MSTQSFADLGVSKAVVDALTARGITEPFQIQRDVIEDVRAGRDVLARSPTGSGKTLAFGVPLIDRTAAEAKRPAALVLAPTRELAIQIVEELRPIAHARALRMAAVYGGVGLQKQGTDASRAHIIVATPGRLEDQLQRGAFTLNHVRTLVLDEADRMLDMGFRPAVDRIVALCRSDRQTLFFSATLDGPAGEAARRYTSNPVSHAHGPTQRRANEDVEHRFVEISHDERLDALISELSSKRELAVVFVRTKHGADKLVKRLAGHGIEAVAMHGNKTQAQRERALAAFENWRVDTLVATDVAARGLDVAGISHVINFDPPQDSETYVHRVGRTARAGATGIGVTLVAPDQRRDVAMILKELGITHSFAGGGGGAQGGRSQTGGGHDGGHAPRGAGNGSPTSHGGPGGGARNSAPGSGAGRGQRPGSGRRSHRDDRRTDQTNGRRRAR
jgi:ATP-dependent RNA helicase RhlE